MSRRVVGWTLLGVVAFGAALLVRLPAAWLGSWLPAGVTCSAFGGTVWQGSCSVLTITPAPARTLQLERVDWTLEPLALLRGQLAAGVSLLQAGGTAEGHLALSFAGDIEVRQLTGRIPVDARLLPMLPAGWRADLAADALGFAHDAGGITHLAGEASLIGLRDGAGNPLGSYALRFAPGAASPPFPGELRDLGGPLSVQAAARIEANGAWQIDGRVAPRPEASPGLARQLSALGLPAADGSYPFSIAGEAG